MDMYVCIRIYVVVSFRMSSKTKNTQLCMLMRVRMQGKGKVAVKELPVACKVSYNSDCWSYEKEGESLDSIHVTVNFKMTGHDSDTPSRSFVSHWVLQPQKLVSNSVCWRESRTHLLQLQKTSENSKTWWSGSFKVHRTQQKPSTLPT